MAIASTELVEREIRIEAPPSVVFEFLTDPAMMVRWMGTEAVLREIEQLREAWEGDTLEPVTDFIAAPDRVIVRDRWHGTGRGPDADMEFTRVFTLRGGKIVSIQIFWDHAEALVAAGLSEKATSQENVEIVRRAYDA